MSIFDTHLISSHNFSFLEKRVIFKRICGLDIRGEILGNKYDNNSLEKISNIN